MASHRSHFFIGVGVLIRFLIFTALACGVVDTAAADLLLDFSPDPGIQSEIQVASGDVVTVTAIYTAESGTATLFGDSIGLDLNWGLAGDQATAITVGSATAGTAANNPAAGSVRDMVNSSTVSGGDALANANLVAGGSAFFNFGGAGMSDLSDISFGGISNRSNSPVPFELMRWQLQVTGDFGDQLRFLPTGILDLDGVPNEVEGNVFLDGPPNAGISWSPATIVGGSITVVPEPVGLGWLIGSAWIGLRRHRKKGA